MKNPFLHVQHLQRSLRLFFLFEQKNHVTNTILLSSTYSNTHRTCKKTEAKLFLYKHRRSFTPTSTRKLSPRNVFFPTLRPVYFLEDLHVKKCFSGKQAKYATHGLQFSPTDLGELPMVLLPCCYGGDHVSLGWHMDVVRGSHWKKSAPASMLYAVGRLEKRTAENHYWIQ